MRNYCTLTDRGYLSKFLVLHESLSKHSSEPFTLHVLAMDRSTHVLIHEMQLAHVNILPLPEFEHALHLAPIRQTRSWQEYAWTCASNLMEYLMPWLDADGVTYLDADLMFFSDPACVFDEIGDKSIGITPHRFPPERKHMEVNGRFNVGLVHAKNTDAGRKCITRWAKNCRDWCFNRVEGHHACGDQKYLDTWESDFPDEVRAIENIGVNVAPWNVSQYDIAGGPTVNGKAIVFYHVHEFKDPRHLTNYALRWQAIEHIYGPYVEAWRRANECIAKLETVLEENRKSNELQAERA